MVVRIVNLLMDKSLAAPGGDELAGEHILNGCAALFLADGHVHRADFDAQRFELIGQGGFLGIHILIVTQEFLNRTFVLKFRLSFVEREFVRKAELFIIAKGEQACHKTFH